MPHGQVTNMSIIKVFVILFLIVGVPAVVLNIIANSGKIKELFDRVKNSSIMASLVLNSFVGILLFSIFGVLINLILNNDATQYQFGVTRHIDTTLLTDYKWIRNLFIIVGIIAGFITSLVNRYKKS